MTARAALALALALLLSACANTVVRERCGDLPDGSYFCVTYLERL